MCQHSTNTNVTLMYAGAVSGQRVSAGFPRPSQNAVPSAVPLQGWCTLPLRSAISITVAQGVVAKNVGIIVSRVVVVLNNTQRNLHSVSRPALQRTPSLPFHSRRASRFKTACCSAFGNRPRSNRRARHSGHSVCRLTLHYGRGQRLSLLTTSLHYPPVCILQPTEPVPPTVCVLETASGGPATFAESLTFPLRHLSDEIRRWYP